MTLYRGPGGTGSATSDADTTLYQEFLTQAQAARDAALQAETNAELAETNAETAQSAAQTSATSAASSASAASTSATNAASSASSASSSASAASTSATNAASSATTAASSASSASSSASAASTSATNAASSATASASSASAASTSATNAANSATSASNSASTATTQATNAASSATAAASSATSASTSATNAANSASAAATSATNAANSATAAAASAASIDPATLVRLTGDQTIAGIKTFSSNPIINAGTANQVQFLNGSKALTGSANMTFNGTTLTVADLTDSSLTSGRVVYAGTGGNLVNSSALTFDGTNLGVGTTPTEKLDVYTNSTANTSIKVGNTSGALQLLQSNGIAYLYSAANQPIAFSTNNTEQMRLTSTGLGIGTSSPTANLTVAGGTHLRGYTAPNTSFASLVLGITGGEAYVQPYTTGLAQIPMNLEGSTVKINTGGSTRVTVDSVGNLGLGVTPSAWGGSFKAIQFGTGAGVSALYNSNSNNTYLGSNAYYDGAANRYVFSNPAGLFGIEGNSFKWYTAPSGTAGNAISFTQAMTLDASGNLFLGTSSGFSSAGITSQTINGASGSRTEYWVGGSAVAKIYTDTDFNLWMTGSGAMRFQTNGSERARIDSSGQMLVGKTSTDEAVQGLQLVGPSGLLVVTRSSGDPLSLRRTSSDGAIASFRRDSTLVGTISVTTSATAYNTSSDYRLKENIQPMTGALAKVAALKPCTYKWKVDGSDGEGFIAHELAEVVPQCVTGEKDAVDADGNPIYQGIDTSFLVATLTAALQEAVAEINQLKADVAALKGN